MSPLSPEDLSGRPSNPHRSCAGRRSGYLESGDKSLTVAAVLFLGSRHLGFRFCHLLVVPWLQWPPEPPEGDKCATSQSGISEGTALEALCRVCPLERCIRACDIIQSVYQCNGSAYRLIYALRHILIQSSYAGSDLQIEAENLGTLNHIYTKNQKREEFDFMLMNWE